jgi:hypothetical protein
MDLCPCPALPERCPGSYIVEAAIALAKIEIVGIGVGCDVASMLDDEKALSLRHIQRSQN